MQLKQIVMADIISAMKAKESAKKGVLQLLKASLENESKEKKRDLTQQEETTIVQRELKQLNDTINEAQKAGRDDLVAVSTAKIPYLEKYLPKQLDEEEIERILTKLGLRPGISMGDAMKIALAELSGKAPNSIISKVVRSLI